MPALMNVYSAINVQMPDGSVKRAQLPDKHYWLIPAGSSDAPMPYEIMTFYNVWSAQGMMSVEQAMKSGALFLIDMGNMDHNVETPLGQMLGHTGDQIAFRPDGTLAMFRFTQRPQ